NNNGVNVNQVESFVKSWLTEHIIGPDKALGEFIQRCVVSDSDQQLLNSVPDMSKMVVAPSLLEYFSEEGIGVSSSDKSLWDHYSLLVNNSQRNVHLMCYVCGEMFTAEELSQHPSDICIETQMNIVKLLPFENHGKKPQAPQVEIPTSESDSGCVDEYNRQALESVENFKCKCLCGLLIRTNLLSEHAKNCSDCSKYQSATKIQTLVRGKLDKVKLNRLVICFMCGNPIDMREIVSHQQQSNCFAQCEFLRSELPSTPSNIRGSIAIGPDSNSFPFPSQSSSAESLRLYNEAALSCYRLSMCVCPICKSRVDLDKMKRHLQRHDCNGEVDRSLHWVDQLDCGIIRIDDIHKALVNHLNELISCYVRNESFDKLQSMWIGTLSHTNTHFADEEMLMQRFQYEDSAWGIHRQKHVELICILLRFIDQALNINENNNNYNNISNNNNSNNNNNNNGVNVNQVESFVKSWLTEHIIGPDKALGEFIQRCVVSDSDQQLLNSVPDMSKMVVAPSLLEYFSEEGIGVSSSDKSLWDHYSSIVYFKQIDFQQ
ncbi:MAG: hypothetical protein EZS28_014212, partial [Streblomastix strix]